MENFPVPILIIFMEREFDVESLSTSNLQGENKIGLKISKEDVSSLFSSDLSIEKLLLRLKSIILFDQEREGSMKKFIKLKLF